MPKTINAAGIDNQTRENHHIGADHRRVHRFGSQSHKRAVYPANISSAHCRYHYPPRSTSIPSTHSWYPTHPKFHFMLCHHRPKYCTPSPTIHHFADLWVIYNFKQVPETWTPCPCHRVLRCMLTLTALPLDKLAAVGRREADECHLNNISFNLSQPSFMEW